MASEPSICLTLLHLWGHPPVNRPVRNQVELSASNSFLFLPRKPCLGRRCIVDQLEGNVSLFLPTDSPASPANIQYTGTRRQVYSNSTKLAVATMVPGASLPPEKLAEVSTGVGRSPDSIAGTDTTPMSQTILPTRVDAIDRSIRKEGFSDCRISSGIGVVGWSRAKRDVLNLFDPLLYNSQII